MTRVVTRNFTTSSGRTTVGTIGTNISVRVIDCAFIGRLPRLVGRNGIGGSTVSSTIQGVLHVGFQLKLFSGPCISRGQVRRLCTPSRLRTTGRTTIRSTVLLGGRGRALPLRSSMGAITIMNPVTGTPCSRLNA